MASPATAETRAPPTWHAVVSAMAKSACGAVASSLLSALGSKIVAAILGPTGTALVSTLQQIRDAAVNAATANGRTALVQGLSAQDPLHRCEYARTSILIFSIGMLTAATVMVVARERVAVWAGLSRQDSALVAWLAVPVVFNSAFVFLSALANIFGEIGKLAWVQVILSAVTAAGAWPLMTLVREGNRGALDLWLAINALSTVGAGWWMIAKHSAKLRTWINAPGQWWNWPAARHFFSISGAMMATALLGSVVMLGLRARIIHAEGLNGAGWFDAAWAVSMRHVTLVLSSLQTYYLPLLASARNREERSHQIGRVLMVSTLVIAPLVIALELSNPWVLSLLYADSFRPAGGLLRWTLVGDYLKVTCWVLAMPMLAIADMKTFLATDLTAQTVFVGSALAFSAVFKPSEATAIAFVVCYVVNLATCYSYARRRHALRPTLALTVVWSAGLVFVVAAAMLSRD
jgi:O-antigen/teichoic acid export membrane protein